MASPDPIDDTELGEFGFDPTQQPRRKGQPTDPAVLDPGQITAPTMAPSGKMPAPPSGPLDGYMTNDLSDDPYAPGAGNQPVSGGTTALPSPPQPGPSGGQPTTGSGSTGWQTPGSGDTGYDWLGFLQGYLGTGAVSRGGSQGGYFAGGGQYRGNLQSIVDAFNSKTGAHAKVAGEDKIDFGDGKGPTDILTGDGYFWYGGAPGSMQPGTSGGAGGSSGGGGTGNPPGAPPIGGSDDAIHQAIMDLLKRGTSPIDPNDPTMKAQFDPIDRQLQRGAQRTREAAAQRRAFEGTNVGGAGGALDADVGSINEDLGAQEGSAMGKLVTSELSARRQDVVNAIGFAQGEQRLQLQSQLQAIDAELRRRGLDQQNSQFYDEFSRQLGNDQNHSLEELIRTILGR